MKTRQTQQVLQLKKTSSTKEKDRKKTKTTTVHSRKKEKKATPHLGIHARRPYQPIPLLVPAINDIFRAIVFN
jgi:hypothetical protein